MYECATFTKRSFVQLKSMDANPGRCVRSSVKCFGPFLEQRAKVATIQIRTETGYSDTGGSPTADVGWESSKH